MGEAAGKDEDKEGRPFVGAAGKLLRDVVADIVPTPRIHYTNASLYRPVPRGRADSRPLPTQLAKERPRLFTEILMLRPKAVVALGASASLALAPNAYKVRGRVVDVTWLGFTVPVYFTWHPAFVFRNPDAYPDICEDIERASRSVRPLMPEISLVTPNPGEQITFEGDFVTVDVETDGTPVHLSNMRCATFTDATRCYLCIPENVEVFNDGIQRFGGRVVGHNTPGDEAVLRRAGIAIRFTDDTLLHHHAHDSRRGSHGLKTLGPLIGGVDTFCDSIAAYIGKGDRLADTDEPAPGWAAIPNETLFRYCGSDGAATAAVHRALLAGDDERTVRLYSFLRLGLRNFSEGLVRGVRINRSLLGEQDQGYAERLKELRGEFSFDPASHDETIEALNKEGYNIRDTRKETLQRLSGDLPKRVLAFRKVEKLWSAFLHPLYTEWLRDDDLLHPLHKLYGTGSGRTSSSEPNVQQIPANLKDLFIAREGHSFIGWDFKAHEVRGLAYWSDDTALLSRLPDPNFDPHQEVAEIAGADVPRKAGKRGVFARAYGASENKLWSTGEFPSRESVGRVMAAVDKLFPGLGRYREETIRQMMEVGYLETPFGRRRYFPYVNRRNRHHLENVACNFLPQSLCNDIALSTGNLVWERLGYPTLLFVHDFCLIEVPDKEVKKVARFVQHMDPFPNEKVRFVPEVYISQTWGGMKDATALDDSSDSDSDNDGDLS